MARTEIRPKNPPRPWPPKPKMDPTAVVEQVKREHPVTSRIERAVEPRRAVTESQPREPRR